MTHVAVGWTTCTQADTMAMAIVKSSSADQVSRLLLVGRWHPDPPSRRRGRLTRGQCQRRKISEPVVVPGMPLL